MQDFCPLCLKNGIKKKVTLLQINLQDAVWMCEEEKCVWPFGYEDFVFSQRVVGKIWSCYWNDNKPRLKENTALVKPSLNTPVSDISNIIDTKIDIIKSDITCNDKSIEYVSNKEEYKDLQLNNIVKEEKVEDEDINVLNEFAEEKDTCSQNIKIGSIVRGIPKITSIERTNIDISSVKIENQISVYQDHDKTNSKSAKSEIGKLLNIGSTKNNEIKPNLNVTMMEIEGLPPITLSFEIPMCTATPETVMSNTQERRNNNVKENNPSFLKKNISGGKQYEKFSFSALMKKNNDKSCLNETSIKIEDVENCSTNFNSPNVESTSNNDKETVASLNTCTSNQLDNSLTNLLSQEDALSDSSAVNTSVNIDTVLKDFLTNDYNTPEDINDDWINSLLN